MSLFWIVLGQLDSTESMLTSKKVITGEEWERKLKDVKIRKEDMNKLVMNFLVTEGYVEAAEKFRIETGTEHIDLATITNRMAVKKVVQSREKCLGFNLAQSLSEIGSTWIVDLAT